MTLASIALLLAMQGGQAVDTYGKTEAQVLQMGQASWYKFYVDKAGGESTATMSNAYGIYADIAAARNDRLLADPKTKRRHEISTLRKMILDFGSGMLDLGTIITGGGTMWNNITAAEYAEAQDTIYALIHPAGAERATKAYPSQVLKLLNGIPKKLNGAVSDQVLERAKLPASLKTVDDSKKLFLRIVNAAKTFDRPASDQLMQFCLDQAKLVTSF